MKWGGSIDKSALVVGGGEGKGEVPFHNGGGEVFEQENGGSRPQVYNEKGKVFSRRGFISGERKDWKRHVSGEKVLSFPSRAEKTVENIGEKESKAILPSRERYDFTDGGKSMG